MIFITYDPLEVCGGVCLRYLQSPCPLPCIFLCYCVQDIYECQPLGSGCVALSHQQRAQCDSGIKR